MSGKFWAALGVLAVVGVAAAAFLLRNPSKLVVSRPNAEIAPASLVAYFEADDVAGLKARLETRESWRHLAASALLDEFRESETGKAWNDLMERLETGANYRIDGARAMRFVGRQVSFGMDAFPESGDPAWIVLTKLDVDGLVGELLEGKGDWTKLQDELERRTGKMEFAVAKSEHKGFHVTSATRGEVAFHASLLGDTLVVSDSPDLLRRAIDTLEAGGAGSLSQSPRFRDEIARLGPGGAVRQWLDLEALRGQKDRIGQWADVQDPTGRASAALLRVLEGTSNAPALACAVQVPDGDLYRLEWSWTRTAAELAGGSSPATLTQLVHGAPVTVEVRQPMRVVEAWQKSALKRRVMEGPIGKKLEEWSAGWTALRDDLPPPLRMAFGGPPDFEDPDETEPTGKEEAPVAAAERLANDPFAVKMGLHMLWEGVTSCLQGDVVLSGDLGDEAKPDIVMAARLGTDGHLLWLVGEGVGLAEGKMTRREGTGGAAIYVMKDLGPKVGDTSLLHVGDVFVVSSTDHGLSCVMERTLSAPAAAAPAPEGLRDGWSVLWTWDGTIGRKLVERITPDPDEQERMAAMLPGTGAAALYVDDALRSVEFDYRYALRNGLELVPGAAEPAVWGWIPEETILAGGASLDLAAAAAWMRVALGPESAPELDGMMKAGSEAIGLDIEKELLPALGPELAVAVTYAAAPPGNDEEPRPFVPGVLIAASTRDETVVAKAIDGVLGALEQARSEASGRRASSFPTVRRLVRGPMTEYRFEPSPEEGVPPGILPTVSFGQGHLLVGLGDAVVTAATDAGLGQGKPFAGSALCSRVKSAFPEIGPAWFVLDWNRLLDQIGAYAPLFGEVAAPDELPDGRKRPQFPDDPDEESWTKFEQDMEAWGKDARKAGVERARRWIDAARLVDFVASTGTSGKGFEERRIVVRFAE